MSLIYEIRNFINNILSRRVKWLRKDTDTAEIRGAPVSTIRELGSVPVIRLARFIPEPETEVMDE